MVPLYKALVRMILEFANVVWSPYKGVCKALCRSQEFVADHDVKVVKGMKGWGKRRGEGWKSLLKFTRIYTLTIS